MQTTVVGAYGQIENLDSAYMAYSVKSADDLYSSANAVCLYSPSAYVAPVEFTPLASEFAAGYNARQLG